MTLLSFAYPDCVVIFEDGSIGRLIIRLFELEFDHALIDIVLEDDYFELHLVGKLDYLFICQDQGLLGTDVEKGARFAAKVSDKVTFIPEDNLGMLPTD